MTTQDKIEREINKIKDAIERGERHLKPLESNKSYSTDYIEFRERIKENREYIRGYLDGLRFLQEQQ